MKKPLSPKEVRACKKEVLPEEVIEIFNHLIIQNFKNGEARVLQKEAIKAICEKMNISSTEVFAKEYLEVEDAFRVAGWKAIYDKPDYGEYYEPFFTFRE